MDKSEVKEALVQVARLMVISAITAPKARGVDNVVCKVVEDEGTISMIADEMERLSSELSEVFLRDSKSLRNTKVLVLMGCKIAEAGMKERIESMGITEDVALSIINLGIALGSAVKTASMLNVDNRIMFTVGKAAKRLGLLDADIVLGIPMSVTPKNIYFDRRN
ncbi:MAG: DUF2148 domain-containing protein [Candidatus Korarchaeum sp.]|nr:DUF2148 domain-containing protein [Candidatus Korarchaeum sp.]MDW8036402.1 DUF2148 domain-containing protein [Candidatus Korarchaeum sp.]